MPFFERYPTTDPDHIDETRRYAIGGHVIAASFMHSFTKRVAHWDTRLMFPDENKSAYALLDRISDDGIGALLDDISNQEPTRSHKSAARTRMGLIAEFEKDEEENLYVPINSDMFVAALYLKDPQYAGKLDAQIGVGNVLDETLTPFLEYYFSRAKSIVEIEGIDTDLPDLVNYTTHDSTYWLQ